MKKNSIMIVVALVLSSLFFMDCFMFPEGELAGKSSLGATDSKGVAVVELFTSEGCSSCPSADALMAKMQGEVSGRAVYFLAYHVDYWDQLGWKDRFSSGQFTGRQQQYQDWLGLNVMYTPQFVVNGASEFGGDSERTLYSKVSDALKIKAASEIALRVAVSGDSLRVNYTVSDVQKNSSLFIATVEKKATTKVARGENSRRLLHHVQIVRQTTVVVLDKKEGSVVILKPENFNEREWELVGFVQDNVSGVISGATKGGFN